MVKTRISELNEFGQSAWLDYISRSLMASGKLEKMIGLGLRGMTSNPTIFDKAIGSGNDYDKIIQKLNSDGKSTFEIYDEITVRDVQDAADIFAPVYKESKGLDGYVSLEVNPKLAYSTRETIEEGRRLHKKVNRPNVMFKVPSTKEGFEAIEELTASGINVNITLIFSLKQYINSARAYIKGIKGFLQSGGDASKVRSVASVFVSRIDTAVDKALDQMLSEERDSRQIAKLTSLKGTAAVANSQIIYGEFLKISSSGEFKQLEKRGVNVQRVLWGSTSTKNPAYSDIKYVTDLIGRDTVNTLPENALEAFLDHGEVKEALTSDVSNAENIISNLKKFKIDVDEVCAKLLEDGVVAFEKSFDSLLETIARKSEKLYTR